MPGISSASIAPQKSYRRVGFLALATLLVLFISAELTLRLIVGLGNPIRYQLDLACGYMASPNQHLRRFSARTEINSYGLRCPEFAVKKPNGVLRLMFLGDSITYGTTRVDQNDIFVELIRQELSRTRHQRVEEINASVNGWAISNELGYLRSRGIRHSDYVLLVLNSGDPAQPFSTFSEAERSGLMATHWIAIGELLSRTLSLHTRQDPGTAVQNDAGTERANLRDLSAMVELSRHAGGGFAVVFVPFRREIPTGATSSVPPALKQWAASEQVPLVDLTAAVSGYKTDLITLSDRTHFNKLGNRLLASSLKKNLGDLLARRSTKHHA